MASLRTFEELEAWQQARALTQTVYRLSTVGAFGRDLALREQLRRAGVSSMANIAEGFERGGIGEFLRFLSIAKGSVGEVRSGLYVALDRGYLDRQTFERCQEEAGRTAILIGGLMRYVKGLRR